MSTRNWVKGEVINRHQWTDTLHSLQVQAPVEPFKAGQFTKLGLEIDGEWVDRPYSYVNPPHEEPLEFYFIEVEGGPLTREMIALGQGDELWVQSKPAGLFTLADVPAGEDLWLMATGTALGVFLSILKTEEPWQQFRNVVLVHGVRTGDELTYQKTIDEIAQAHDDQFKMLSCVSRDKTHNGAFGGRITKALEDEWLEKTTGLEIHPERSQVMICGNRDMIKDVTDLLTDRGLTRNRRSKPGNITTENYF